MRVFPERINRGETHPEMGSIVPQLQFCTEQKEGIGLGEVAQQLTVLAGQVLRSLDSQKPM